jgi:predicted methyltransferase
MTKRILVRCPTTAKLTATGQTVEEELWAETKLKKERKVTCVHCQGTHVWSKKDVVLAR